jgi:hypothetical protein
MTDDAIQELILAFLDARGGYVASASERELFLMVKQACAAERARAIHVTSQAFLATIKAIEND